MPPGGLVPDDYVFDGLDADGARVRVKLSELFASGKDALVIYNFMFPRHPEDHRPGPSEGATAQLKLEDGPCPSCVAFLDQLDGAAMHVAQRRDYHAETPEGFQMPMVTVFHRQEDRIRHFWSSEMLYAPTDPGEDPRHSGTLEPLWNIFDLTPEGRPPDWEEQLDYDAR